MSSHPVTNHREVDCIDFKDWGSRQRMKNTKLTFGQRKREASAVVNCRMLYFTVIIYHTFVLQFTSKTA